MTYLRSFLLVIALTTLILWVSYLSNKIEELQSDINMTMEFSILQAQKIDDLENQCDKTAVQVAAICSICSEYSYEITVEEE